MLDVSVASTTPDQWESDKLTVIHHKREPRGQPAGDHKAQINRRAQKHNKPNKCGSRGGTGGPDPPGKLLYMGFYRK